MSEERFATVNNDAVTVGSSSTKVLDVNNARAFAVFVNNDDEVVFLSLGAAAELNKGIRLNANGGAWEMNSENLYKGAVYVICTSGSKKLCFTEGTD